MENELSIALSPKRDDKYDNELWSVRWATLRQKFVINLFG
jgi:hypothetical protein